jgi:hypothetical protein
MIAAPSKDAVLDHLLVTESVPLIIGLVPVAARRSKRAGAVPETGTQKKACWAEGGTVVEGQEDALVTEETKEEPRARCRRCPGCDDVIGTHDVILIGIDH